MAARGHHDHAGAAGRAQGGPQPGHQLEVAQVVGRELRLVPRASRVNGVAMIPALATSRCRGRPEARNPSAKASTDTGSIRSIAATSTPSIPSSAAAARAVSWAGTTTSAPAARRTRTVSRPMPE